MKSNMIDLSTLPGDCRKLVSKWYYFNLEDRRVWSFANDSRGRPMEGRKEVRGPRTYNFTMRQEWQQKHKNRLVTINHNEIEAQATRNSTLDVFQATQPKEQKMKLIDMVITANVPAKAVEALIKESVEKETGREVESITATFSESSSYMGRDTYTIFDGFKVTFKS